VGHARHARRTEGFRRLAGHRRRDDPPDIRERGGPYVGDVTRGVAALAAVTGIAPSALAELDLTELAALAKARRDHWGHDEELLALIAELLDALIRVTVQLHSDPKKRPRLPPVLRYPRPGTPSAPQRTVIHPRDLARRMLAGR
jgi:hypothetical protein